MILKWSPELELGIEAMDLTHREFVDQLNAMVSLPDDEMAEAFTRLLNHTVEHFGREKAWMQKHGYAGAEAHVDEHDRVLKVMTAIAEFIETGESRIGRMAARDLAGWFRQHARTMDAGLARVLQAADAGTAVGASPPEGSKRPGVPKRKRAGSASAPGSSTQIKRRKS